MHFCNAESRGFSIIEALLGSAVLALLVTAIVGALIFGRESATTAGARTRAAFLAEEGMEAVRNIKDADFCNLTVGTHGLSSGSGKWEFSGTGDMTEKFSRTVDIVEVNPQTRQVTVTVTWQQNPQRTGTISLVGYFTFWKSTPTTWWDTNWLNRRKITFANGTRGQLDNFPVLIALTAPTNIDYAKTQNNGEDIRFVDPDDIANSPPCIPAPILSHEIERWNEGGTSYLWVKGPKIDANSTTDFIWMYYNNPAAPDPQIDSAFTQGVWSNGYVGVWHMKEVPPAQIKDSTVYANHGTPKGGMDAADSITGQIGSALDFDGGVGGVPWDYLDAGNSPSLQISGVVPITLEAWAVPHPDWFLGVNNGTKSIAAKYKGGVDPDEHSYTLRIGGTERWTFYLGSGPDASRVFANTPTDVITPSTGWDYVVGTYDGVSTLYVYNEGVLGGTGTPFPMPAYSSI